MEIILTQPVKIFRLPCHFNRVKLLWNQAPVMIYSSYLDVILLGGMNQENARIPHCCYGYVRLVSTIHFWCNECHPSYQCISHNPHRKCLGSCVWLWALSGNLLCEQRTTDRFQALPPSICCLYGRSELWADYKNLWKKTYEFWRDLMALKAALVLHRFFSWTEIFSLD